MNFDQPQDHHPYTELSLSREDFQPPARTDAEIRQYIVHKAHWLAYRFPRQTQTDGILYPIPFDEPADLDYLGVRPGDILKNTRRLANQGLLEKVLEGNARPTELLLSRYESGDHAGLGVPSHSLAQSDDRKFAQLAIEEARKSLPEDGRVHPKVGAVVVKDRRVVRLPWSGSRTLCLGFVI